MEDYERAMKEHMRGQERMYDPGEPKSVGRPKDPSEIRALKKEIHRKIGIANKRIDRLKEQGLENTPAYRNLIQNTGVTRFSIKSASSKNELRRLEGQLDKFIGMKTSTVTGVKKWKKGIADTLGVNYEKVSEIGKNLDNYIELLGKLTQYQRSQGGIEEGSERRVTAIDKYIKENDIHIGAVDPDDLVQLVDEMMKDEEEAYNRMLGEWEASWFDENGV